jgi:hypothetical protein
MKVLILKGKYGDTIVAARTPEEEGRAWLYLFKQIDNMGYYVDLTSHERDILLAARGGKAKAAKLLLDLRSDYEYEEIMVETAVEP